MDEVSKGPREAPPTSPLGRGTSRVHTCPCHPVESRLRAGAGSALVRLPVYMARARVRGGMVVVVDMGIGQYPRRLERTLLT